MWLVKCKKNPRNAQLKTVFFLGEEREVVEGGRGVRGAEGSGCANISMMQSRLMVKRKLQVIQQIAGWYPKTSLIIVRLPLRMSVPHLAV